MAKSRTTTLSPDDQKLLAGLEKSTRVAREKAEAALAEQMFDRGNWVDGAERFAPALLDLAVGNGPASGPAMRLLGHLVSEGERAISTGPIPGDPLLKKIDPPYAKLLKDEKLRTIAASLAAAAPAVAKQLSSESADLRGSAAFLLAHIPEAGKLLPKLEKAAKTERDVAVKTAMTFAIGFLCRYAKKPAPAQPSEGPATVRAAAVLARLVANAKRFGDEERGALLAGIAAPVLDRGKFPWREGFVDKVVSNVVGNRVGHTAAAQLVARSANEHPDDERSITWAAATLALGFEERSEMLSRDDLSEAQREMLAQISVRDWTQLNTEFTVYGLPPHAEDRLALLETGASTHGVLERKVRGPKGEETVLAALLRFEKKDAPFVERHAFLAKHLTTAEHLEVARLAATQAMGLSDIGDADAIAVAQRDPEGARPWAAEVIREAKARKDQPMNDFWVSLALYVELASGSRRDIEPELDPSIYADARGGVMSETVLRAVPNARREALLSRAFSKSAMTNLVAFVPLVAICPTARILDMFLRATDPKLLDAEFGPGARAQARKKILPHLDRMVDAFSGVARQEVEARAAALRTYAAG